MDDAGPREKATLHFSLVVGSTYRTLYSNQRAALSDTFDEAQYGVQNVQTETDTDTDRETGIWRGILES